LTIVFNLTVIEKCVRIAHLREKDFYLEAIRLSGYRVFQEKTTYWCPEREEHGYFLTPLFKCTTNPRVPTAHGWSAVDPKGRMNKPTGTVHTRYPPRPLCSRLPAECFFNKEGKWYYAGQYIAIRLEDFTTKEWLALDTEVGHLIPLHFTSDIFTLACAYLLGFECAGEGDANVQKEYLTTKPL
jgi:hypothetical protein